MTRLASSKTVCGYIPRTAGALTPGANALLYIHANCEHNRIMIMDKTFYHIFNGEIPDVVIHLHIQIEYLFL